jgi:NADH:ubiquinone oxidoreductase subunit 4 (subunit M)
MKDLSFREIVVLGSLVIAILLTGLFPQPVIDRAKPAILKTVAGKSQDYRTEKTGKIIPVTEVVTVNE